MTKRTVAEYTCDRCGTIATGSAADGWTTFTLMSYGHDREVHLCVYCVEAFQRFLGTKAEDKC